MDTIDEFGKDPTVQRTRKLFSQMESMDKALVESLNLSRFDSRLRAIRETREICYEKTFTRAMYKGFYFDEKAALELFTHCQKIAVTKNGFSYPFGFSENPEILSLIQEATK